MALNACQKKLINELLEAQANLNTLRFITCGSVDDGKSTLIGRLLYEAGSILDDQLTALKAESKDMELRAVKSICTSWMAS